METNASASIQELVVGNDRYVFELPDQNAIFINDEGHLQYLNNDEMLENDNDTLHYRSEIDSTSSSTLTASSSQISSKSDQQLTDILTAWNLLHLKDKLDGM